MPMLTAPHQSIKTDSVMENELHEYVFKGLHPQTVPKALKLMMLKLISGKHLALSVDKSITYHIVLILTCIDGIYTWIF